MEQIEGYLSISQAITSDCEVIGQYYNGVLVAVDKAGNEWDGCNWWKTEQNGVGISEKFTEANGPYFGCGKLHENGQPCPISKADYIAKYGPIGESEEQTDYLTTEEAKNAPYVGAYNGLGKLMVLDTQRQSAMVEGGEWEPNVYNSVAEWLHHVGGDTGTWFACAIDENGVPYPLTEEQYKASGIDEPYSLDSKGTAKAKAEIVQPAPITPYLTTEEALSSNAQFIGGYAQDDKRVVVYDSNNGDRWSPRYSMFVPSAYMSLNMWLSGYESKVNQTEANKRWIVFQIENGKPIPLTEEQYKASGVDTPTRVDLEEHSGLIDENATNALESTKVVNVGWSKDGDYYPTKESSTKGLTVKEMHERLSQEIDHVTDRVNETKAERTAYLIQKACKAHDAVCACGQMLHKFSELDNDNELITEFGRYLLEQQDKANDQLARILHDLRKLT